MGVAGFDYWQEIPLRTDNDTFARINIEVWKLDEQEVNIASADAIKKTDLGFKYSFLIVENVFEQLTHTWSEFQNMGARMTQTLQGVDDTVKDVTSSALSLYKRYTGNEGTASTGFEAKRMKADSPLIYDKSERRRFNLTVKLFSQNDPETINNVVLDFKKFSSARKGDKAADILGRIEFPYIFRVYSYPVNFINFEDCVLNTMNATYHFPFMDGYSTDIDLVMEFEDLRPLYAESFEDYFNVTASVG